MMLFFERLWVIRRNVSAVGFGSMRDDGRGRRTDGSLHGPRYLVGIAEYRERIEVCDVRGPLTASDRTGGRS